MSEREKLDEAMAVQMDLATRQLVWDACDDILQHGPLAESEARSATGLALGYVQSGKTTTITALIAAAADEGYRVIVALLGSTNLLLDQNSRRIESALTADSRAYRWVFMQNVKERKAHEVDEWLDRGRVVVLTLLKHAGHVNNLAAVLRACEAKNQPVLIIDDEADQASLNTSVSDNQLSKTYASLTNLRGSVDEHLYVQFTATPYAPLLLDLDDHLKPEFVTLLHPGPGYTGGREFFVDEAEKVIRIVPAGDEQSASKPPVEMPGSLETALANFVVGAGMLLGLPGEAAPVSMLIHSTQSNKIQQVYKFLVDRQLRKWREDTSGAETIAALPKVLRDEHAHLVSLGAASPPEHLFLQYMKEALREATTWLINSASDLKSVRWNLTPVHILVGGNKLDRGFTVEGLTVTYMNRPASEQVDTLEQRSRAFGYRRKLLPYCQFFSTARTLEVLRGIVYTEYDLRATLEDALGAGRSVHEWSTEIGLRLPPGTRPSRPSVLGALNKFSPPSDGWLSLRQPSRDEADIGSNASLVEGIGLLDADRLSYGALSFRTVQVPVEQLLEEVLEPWLLKSYSAGWRHQDILDYLMRHLRPDDLVPVILMDDQEGGSRTRRWTELGFVNLFQGRSADGTPPARFYGGDRTVVGPANDHPYALQVHFVTPRGSDQALHTLAVHMGTQQIVRKR
ncbi:Z1 domain-containing protein [Aeromicrobium sp. Leaf245]|uniref:Z1 domain-containing protein n=1 Tax=Aeromicrobium sp. Leaf245 TaxID=1736306 RepID=UPI0006F57A87|nr:Z1 domain-containing protein [Aeromicrobium sp. Leaf245]KQO38896.1 hypothetical protein ASF05_03175 [Aeromicrobium sp. Leaf245]